MAIRRKLAHLKTVLRDWRWWPFYLQRRFREPETRRRIGDVLARWRPAHTPPPSVLPAIATLQRDGLVRLGTLLDPQQCGALTAYFSTLPVYDPYRDVQARQPFLPLSTARHPDAHIAHHHAADVVRAPGLLALANSPAVLDVVGAFLGCKPTLGYLAAWWSYPTALGAQQAENFHRDVDDWRFLKLFVYLSDVGPDNGPHVYVAGSATQPVLTRLRRFDDAEVRAAFGASALWTMTGQAGEAFLENTFGVHKGQPVKVGRRLIFQAVYSLYPLPYSPKRPVVAAGDVPVAVDPFVNRLYLRT